MELLPDAAFSLSSSCGSEALVWDGNQVTLDERKKLELALKLPTRFLVKWVRAQCLTSLDLSNPGSAWTLESWQRVAACLHVVPLLKTLKVPLPKYKAPTLQNAAKSPCSYNKCIRGACASKPPSLSFHCYHCRYVPQTDAHILLPHTICINSRYPVSCQRKFPNEQTKRKQNHIAMHLSHTCEPSKATEFFNCCTKSPVKEPGLATLWPYGCLLHALPGLFVSVA